MIKLFCPPFADFRNKLERLSLASISSLVKRLWVRPRAYPRVEHLKGTNTLALNDGQKSFITLALGRESGALEGSN